MRTMIQRGIWGLMGVGWLCMAPAHAFKTDHAFQTYEETIRKALDSSPRVAPRPRSPVGLTTWNVRAYIGGNRGGAREGLLKGGAEKEKRREWLRQASRALALMTELCDIYNKAPPKEAELLKTVHNELSNAYQTQKAVDFLKDDCKQALSELVKIAEDHAAQTSSAEADAEASGAIAQVSKVGGCVVQ